MSMLLCGCFGKQKLRKGNYEQGSTKTSQSLPPLRQNIFQEQERSKLKDDDFDKLLHQPKPLQLLKTPSVNAEQSISLDVRTPNMSRSNQSPFNQAIKYQQQSSVQSEKEGTNKKKQTRKNHQSINEYSKKVTNFMEVSNLPPLKLSKQTVKKSNGANDAENSIQIQKVNAQKHALTSDNQLQSVDSQRQRSKTVNRIEKEEPSYDRMPQIQESEHEWEDNQTEENFLRSKSRTPINSKIQIRQSKKAIYMNSGMVRLNSMRQSQKDSSSRLLGSNINTNREGTKDDDIQESGAAGDTGQQTFVVTEEDQLDRPYHIINANMHERRRMEKEFFENVKKDSHIMNQETLYIVDIEWVKQWTNFLSGQGKVPGKISNKNLYKKYYMQGQKLQVSQDYYFMTHKMWKFLYSIYGGGPIMKKTNKPFSTGNHDQYSIHHKELLNNLLGDTPQFQSINRIEENKESMSSFDVQSPSLSAQSRFHKYGQTFEIENKLTPIIENSPDLKLMISKHLINREQTSEQRKLQFEDDNSTRPASAMSGFVWYHNPLETTISSSKQKPEKTNTIKNFSPNPRLIPSLTHSIANNSNHTQEKRVVGLDNPSNFCYMNAVIQALLGIPEFRTYFINREFANVSYTTYFQKKIMCQSISKLFKEMLTLEDEFSHLKPTFFHKLIEKKFNSAMQHDAHEFLMYTLSHLQDELNPGPQNEVNRRFSMTSSQSSTFWQNYQQAHPSVIDQLFVGQLSQVVQCKQCENKSTSSMPFKDITLTVSPNLKQSLGLYLATERLESDEKYSCLECQTLTNAKIKKKFVQMPRYMIMHMKRFEETEGEFRKNKRPIEFPLNMDMDDFCNQPWEGLGKFELIGVILHQGKNMGCGHYQAFSKRLDGSWWFCNDAEIKPVSNPEHVLQCTSSVYLLIYQKQVEVKQA